MTHAITRPILATALLATGLATTVSQAAIFTYDSSVSNWYTSWTATGISGWLVVRTNESNQIQVQNASSNTSVPGTHWAGAQWTAPVGQFITQVDLTYWGMINAQGAATLTVYAGTSAATATEVFFNKESLNAAFGSTSLAFSPTSQYTFLQVRNWDGRGGSDFGAQQAPPGWWQSDLTAATITTIPEPAALSLLALGGLCLLRRRRG
ncbi:MAG: PEP-CTERM sorting domain-containing protein [Lentisphaeria bacterium]